MKKMISVILSLFIIFFNVQIAFSANVVSEVFVEDYISGEMEPISFQSVLTGTAPVYKYPYKNGGIMCEAYSLLSNNEKSIYNAIVDNSASSFTITIPFSPYMPMEEFNEIDFTAIMHAICYDHPEIIHYSGYSAGYSYIPYSDGSQAVTKLNYTIRSFSFEPYTASNISAYHTALMNELKTLEFDLTTRYDFVKSVHDYLCETVTYTSDVPSRQNAYGALIDKKCVCQGYAEALKLICDYYKIPCICVTGVGVTQSGSGAHMWNAVQMDDGLWYLIDATWDDQVTRTYYDYFLSGTTTKSSYGFGGTTFSASHIEDAEMAYLPSVPYAATAYDASLKNSGFGATYNSVTIEEDKLIVLSFFEAEENNIYFDGMYVPADAFSTASKFVAPSGTNRVEETWKMALIGDCDGNGTADAEDYSVAVNKVLADASIETPYDYACDACYDGVLDVLDLAVLERAVNGSNTDIELD